MNDFDRQLANRLKKREEERKKLRRWRHYADHAKKRRTRKKYQKKLRDHYAAAPHAKAGGQLRASAQYIHPKCGHFPYGNWPYGIRAGISQRPSVAMRGGTRP